MPPIFPLIHAFNLNEILFMLFQYLISVFLCRLVSRFCKFSPNFFWLLMPPFRFPHTTKFKCDNFCVCYHFCCCYFWLKSFAIVAITFRWCFLFFVFVFVFYFIPSFVCSFIRLVGRSFRREICFSFFYHLKLFAFVCCFFFFFVLFCLFTLIWGNISKANQHDTR